MSCPLQVDLEKKAKSLHEEMTKHVSVSYYVSVLLWIIYLGLGLCFYHVRDLFSNIPISVLL